MTEEPFVSWQYVGYEKWAEKRIKELEAQNKQLEEENKGLRDLLADARQAKPEKCPSCGDHNIQYSELNDLWQCKYCGLVFSP